MPTHRPFFRSTADELRELVNKNRHDLALIQLVAKELKKRTTSKARALAKELEQIEQEVSRVRPNNSTDSPASSRATYDAEPAAASPQETEDEWSTEGITVLEPQVETASETIEFQSVTATTLESGAFERPVHEDTTSSILAAWIALEALSPQTYRRPEDLASGDKRCVANFTPQLPWSRNETSRPKKKLFYQIVLGSIDMDAATARLVSAFGQDEERERPKGERAAIGAVLVDKNGFLLEDDSIAVSSFSWALPLALKRRLEALGEWPVVEEKIKEVLRPILTPKNARGEPLPIDVASILKAHKYLVEGFGLDSDLIEKPSFAIRVYHYFKSINSPEVSLLNSFYLSDLAKAKSLQLSGTAPVGLRRYLGVDPNTNPTNLLNDNAALEKAVAPNTFPLGRWPAPGGHPLVLLQQAAVNLARKDLQKEGIFAVNGPPGTGKTTLLRELVASAVVDRAEAMCGFSNPEEAFVPSGQKVKAGDAAFFQMYKLHPSLRGHELLVASSNNRAVENVSRELPGVKAIGRKITYLKTISDNVANSKDEFNEEPETKTYNETWGLIAAILGNSNNRFTFQQSFWWDGEASARIYLKAAKGDDVTITITDKETGKVVERRTPKVVTIEHPPPTKTSAIQAWNSARKRFSVVKNEVIAQLQELEEVRLICLAIPKEQRKLEIMVPLEKTKASEVRLLSDDLDKLSKIYLDWKEYAQKCQDALKAHRALRPNIIQRLFRTRRWKQWQHSNGEKLQNSSKANIELKSGLVEIAKRRTLVENARTELQAFSRDIGSLRASIERMQEKISRCEVQVGKRIIDKQFFELDHVEKNLTPPWLSAELHEKREELFEVGLDVHRAFVGVAAQKVLHNLSALMGSLTSGTYRNPEKRQLLGDLWATLFLMVPVVSTTFASVDRMLGDLESEALGWLLIDEAGQALPQAAVGAIMRSRRSIVVGDPLQIPPVVSLPQRLTVEICSFFNVNVDRWAAPDASAQTVADRASNFQSYFKSEGADRLAGAPLLVHRRCEEPMFSLANLIAYDGQMVQQVENTDGGEVRKILGPSKWISIDGEAQSKWCPAEGEIVKKIFADLVKGGAVNPNIFIITPFRIVAQQLRRRLEDETANLTKLGFNPEQWITNHVGTVHTFQGREADTVILVLGAPERSHIGARRWAGAAPNILNVAVSRARQNLYVIGSQGAWSGAGVFSSLAQGLPVQRG